MLAASLQHFLAPQVPGQPCNQQRYHDQEKRADKALAFFYRDVAADVAADHVSDN